MYNEEDSIEPLINSLTHSLKKSSFTSFKILVVDDCSTDNSYEIVNSLIEANSSLSLVRKIKRTNVGESFSIAIKSLQTEYFAWIPADGEIPPQIFETLPLPNPQELISHFPVNAKENRTLARQVLSRAFTNILNTLFNKRIKYYNGTTLCPLTYLKKIIITSKGFTINAELILRCLKDQFTQKELPFNFQKRKGGESKAFQIKNIANVLSSLLSLSINLSRKTKK